MGAGAAVLPAALSGSRFNSLQGRNPTGDFFCHRMPYKSHGGAQQSETGPSCRSHLTSHHVCIDRRMRRRLHSPSVRHRARWTRASIASSTPLHAGAHRAAGSVGSHTTRQRKQMKRRSKAYAGASHQRRCRIDRGFSMCLYRLGRSAPAVWAIAHNGRG
eukprot:SAG11_NODE_1464_length_4862_cov_1.419064_6_plen_160_part_00